VVSVTISRPLSAPVSLIRYAQTVPAAFLCLCIAAFGVFTSWITPHSARTWYDPGLIYMLSSLSWFRGQGYLYVDHPGTPVEVIGTLLLGLSYPILHAANEAFVKHYLNHPQDFMSVAQTLIVCASVFVAWLLARRSVLVTDWTQAIVGAGIATVFFIAMPQQSLRVMSMWTHESFNFPAGTLLSLAVVIVIRRAGRPSWKSVLGLGFACGVLASVQLYFGAWIVGTAVALGTATRLRGDAWLKAVRCALVVAAMAGLGFMVGTLPIHDQYPKFLDWIWSVVAHEGTYGRGAPGVINPTQMGSNLVALVLQEKLLFVACGVGVIFLSWRLWVTRHQRDDHPVLWGAGLGLGVQLLVLLLMNAKHPGFGAHYMLPVAATLPLVFAAALDKVDVWPRRTRVLLASVSLAALAVCGRTIQAGIVAYAGESDWLHGIDVETENMLARLAEERSVPRESLRTLWTFGTGSPCFALKLSDFFTDNTFHYDIAQMCPHDSVLINGNLNLAEYHDWDVAVLSDGWVADLDPVARPPGSKSYTSSIDTVCYCGKLVFLTRD
jgi:hypothetical protein